MYNLNYYHDNKRVHCELTGILLTFTNVFTCPFLIIYAFCHNLQTFFYKHDCIKIFMLLKKYPQQTIYSQYKIFI